jgi:hypothetical protein
MFHGFSHDFMGTSGPLQGMECQEAISMSKFVWKIIQPPSELRILRFRFF